MKYEDSLKYDRDLKNSFDTGREDGFNEGREEGREQEKVRIARQLLCNGVPVQVIAGATGMTAERIEKLGDDSD